MKPQATILILSAAAALVLSCDGGAQPAPPRPTRTITALDVPTLSDVPCAFDMAPTTMTLLTDCTMYTTIVTAGLLLYDVYASAIRRSHNTYSNNQFNVLLVTHQSLDS